MIVGLSRALLFFFRFRSLQGRVQDFAFEG